MRAKKPGLAALVVATGVCLSFSGASAMSAATSTVKTGASMAAVDRPLILSKYKKHRHAAKRSRTAEARHLKKSASKESSTAAVQKAVAKEAVEKQVASASETELPPQVANARAQALADDEARNIAALDTANVSTVDGILVATEDPPHAADTPRDAEPHDADTPADTADVVQEPTPPPPQTVAVAPPAPSGQIIRAVPSGEKPAYKHDDGDPWSKTSLIGKIFIAVGSLLTLVSAARLLIA